MNKCTVEMYGLALEVCGISEIELELKDGAHLGELIAELRKKVPVLEGPVINAGEDRLTEHCLFNIDGRFYFGNEDMVLKDGGSVRLLTLATGG